MISFQSTQKHGLTIVELLVAISVLTIVTALLIPRLRIVNEDRNIRETARVVGSAFSSARNRAVGTRAAAGVVIERNLNFVARTMGGTGNRVYYAGTRLTQLEEITPRFTGDAATDFVITVLRVDSQGNDTLQCLINLPLEHDPANGIYAVLPGDELFVGSSIGDSPSFVVKEVLPARTVTFRDSMPGDGNPEDLCGTPVADGNSINIEMLPLNIAFDNDQDPTNALVTTAGTVDFITGENIPPVSTPVMPGTDLFTVAAVNPNCREFIFRQLRKINSSAVDLPAGYLVDLRYSGQLDTDDWDLDVETATVFGLGLADAADPTLRSNREIHLVFDSAGTFDRILVNGVNYLVGQSVNLFINEFNPNELNVDTTAQAQLLLNKPNALWVSVGMQSGTNVVYNIPPGNGAVGSLISSATQFTRNGSSAAQ